MQKIKQLDKIFGEVGISKEWLYLLIHGTTKLYNNDTVILNYLVENDICMINSVSVKDTKFPKSVLKDIKTLINEHKSVIIASKVHTIENYLKRLGFRYNTAKKAYERGITWE